MQTLLLKEGEDATALKKMPPETLLIRWINYHMQKSPGSTLTITNFGSDMQVGVTHVLPEMQLCVWLVFVMMRLLMAVR